MPLTITANSQSRYQGQANSPLTYKITSGSIVAGDMLTGTPSTLATPSSPIGSYPITQGTLAASTNYAISFVPGQVTVLLIPSISVINLGVLAPPQPAGPPFDAGLTLLTSEQVSLMVQSQGSVTLFDNLDIIDEPCE